jgi:hypothetical protein
VGRRSGEGRTCSNLDGRHDESGRQRDRDEEAGIDVD